MNPNACLDQIETALTKRDANEVREHALALQAWIRRGGFYPVGVNPALTIATITHALRLYPPAARVA